MLNIVDSCIHSDNVTTSVDASSSSNRNNHELAITFFPIIKHYLSNVYLPFNNFIKL